MKKYPDDRSTVLTNSEKNSSTAPKTAFIRPFPNKGDIGKLNKKYDDSVAATDRQIKSDESKLK